MLSAPGPYPIEGFSPTAVADTRGCGSQYVIPRLIPPRAPTTNPVSRMRPWEQTSHKRRRRVTRTRRSYRRKSSPASRADFRRLYERLDPGEERVQANEQRLQSQRRVEVQRLHAPKGLAHEVDRVLGCGQALERPVGT